MKKFEIINGKWIRKLVFGKFEEEYISDVLKISEIKRISFMHRIPRSQYDNVEEQYVISVDVSSGISMSWVYEKKEYESFQNDLKFLEELLFDIE